MWHSVLLKKCTLEFPNCVITVEEATNEQVGLPTLMQVFMANTTAKTSNAKNVKYVSQILAQMGQQ